MAATRTTTRTTVAQTTTYDDNPQDRTCLQRFYFCSIVGAILSFMMIVAGAINIIWATQVGQQRMAVKSFQTQKFAGIAVLVIGIIIMTLSCAYCCCVESGLPNTETVFSETTMTTRVVAPNTPSTPDLVQPPIIQGGGGGGGQQTFMDSFQPQQQAGSF